MKANTKDPDQTVPCLILVHIVGNISYQSTQAAKRADGNCREMEVKGFTLYLLVASADSLCKQFGPRSGPTKCQT